MQPGAVHIAATARHRIGLCRAAAGGGAGANANAVGAFFQSLQRAMDQAQKAGPAAPSGAPLAIQDLTYQPPGVFQPPGVETMLCMIVLGPCWPSETTLTSRQVRKLVVHWSALPCELPQWCLMSGWQRS